MRCHYSACLSSDSLVTQVRQQFCQYIMVNHVSNFRRQRLKLHKEKKQPNMPKAQLQLLKQSLFVFILYAVIKNYIISAHLQIYRISSLLLSLFTFFALFQASIISVFAMSFMRVNYNSEAFSIAYVENLLNLSIAAVYPLCFLTTSGEMRRL